MNNSKIHAIFLKMLDSGNPLNHILYKSSADMCEVLDNSVDLVITSPSCFNTKDYSKICKIGLYGIKKMI